MRVLVTGCAGFIGWKVSQKLLDLGYEVVGIDNINDYYDIRIKVWRLEQLKKHKGFKFYKTNIEDLTSLEPIFKDIKFNAIINEAARAGVRYSLENPYAYLTTNVIGTLNLLELMKRYEVPKFVLASTSSLYAGQPMPFKEDLPVNEPISPYAASKKSAEVLAYTYYYLYGIDVSVVRYFTVYGPAGRPDMSIFRFVYWILRNEPVEIFGDGFQSRDFTYIDDIAEGTVKALKFLGYEIINLGNNQPYRLIDVIKMVEDCTGRKAKIVYKNFHKADLKATWADISKAKKILDWTPKTCLEEGINKTVEWFKENWNWVKDTNL